MTRHMGIDCSTNSLAFSVFEEDRLIHWGELSFGKGDIFHRMNNANRMVNQMIKYEPFKSIDSLSFEGAVFINNRQTVINLSYLFGSAISPLVRPGVKATSVPAITWQNYIGNKVFTKAEKESLKKNNPGKTASWYKEKMREMRKQRTIDWVKQEFGVDVSTNDVSDAIGVGWWGVHNA